MWYVQGGGTKARQFSQLRIRRVEASDLRRASAREACLRQVVCGEEDPNRALQHLGNDRAGVSANGLNALGIKCRLLLAWTLVHEAHIPLLGGKHTWVIDLCQSNLTSMPLLAFAPQTRLQASKGGDQNF